MKRNRKQQILFVHQNFPGQYRYLAKHFASDPRWDTYAIGEKACVEKQFHLIPNDITVLGYDLAEQLDTQHLSPRLHHFAKHVGRADTLSEVLLRQKNNGLNPDIILAHPGWGEGLYLKEIFPDAKLVYFFEFFFSTTQNNINFDPEFPSTLPQQLNYRMSNTAILISLDIADAGVSPTQWQRDTHPEAYWNKLSIIHDGVDTQLVKPSQARSVSFKNTSQGDITLHDSDEIVSYSVRNLEPSRGFHRFMRALPVLQSLRPNAHFVIVGGDEKSYSAQHPSGKSWREIMLEEVGEQLDMQRLIFTGKVPYQSLLDLFSITSLHLYWTTPFVLSWSIMEAMACEAPVLASSTEPVKEVITDGDNGFLFDFFDQQQLLDRVVALLENKGLCKTVGQRARQSIIAKYDLHTQCLPQHIELINQVLES